MFLPEPLNINPHQPSSTLINFINPINLLKKNPEFFMIEKFGIVVCASVES